MNFRVSPEEKEMIKERIRLSGLSMQDYYLQSMLYQQVITYGSVKVFDEIRIQITQINEKLKHFPEGKIPDEYTLESLRMITEMIEGLSHHDEDIVSPMFEDHEKIKPLEHQGRFKRNSMPE